MPDELILPRLVRPDAASRLTEQQQVSLLKAVRTPHPGLAQQIDALRHEIGETAAADAAAAGRSPPKASREDIYDKFFSVTRVEDDTDTIGLNALLEAMGGYAQHIASSGSVSELEEATLMEAVQAIVENYGRA